jgi:hypothetical protein
MHCANNNKLFLVSLRAFALQAMLLRSRPMIQQLQHNFESTSVTNPAYHACGGTQSLYTAIQMKERYDVSYNRRTHIEYCVDVCAYVHASVILSRQN